MSGHKSFSILRSVTDAYIKALYYAYGRNDAIRQSFPGDPHINNLLTVDPLEFAKTYRDHIESGGGISVQDCFVMFQAGKTEFNRD